MSSVPTAHFYLDQPARAAVVPAGRVRFQGWALGTGGMMLADLRARTDGRIHAAELGDPRADLARHFGARETMLPGGFECFLHLPPGGHRIDFEALTLAGEWIPVGSTEVTCTGPDSRESRALPIVLEPYEVTQVMKMALRQPEPEAAAAALAAALPCPAVLRYPRLPFHGHLHRPARLERVWFGRLWVEGWLFHEEQKIRRLTATVDLQAAQPLEFKGENPYVTTLFPQFPQAATSCFVGLVDVPSQLPSPLTLRLYAELEDGSVHLCVVQRVLPWDVEHDKLPYTRRGIVPYVRTVLALDRTYRQRGSALEWNWPQFKAAWAALTEFRVRAPRTLVAPAIFSRSAVRGTAALPRQVTLITHNLNREGAPLFLLEYARHLAGLGVRLRVLTGADGLLQSEFTALGAQVEHVDLTDLSAAASLSSSACSCA